MNTSSLVSRRRVLMAGAAGLSLAGAPLGLWAQPVDAGGVKFEPRVTVQGQSLQLNGAGVRYKAIFKVYAAALYLPQKADTTEAIMSMAGPKRITITMLREIDANELGKLFTRGVEDNTPRNEMSRLVTGLIRMGEIFASHKKLVAGDTFTNDWLPGDGMYITVKGKVQGEPFKEPEFFNALLRIWLGKSPADHQLKEALLGKLA
jgi:hypothetical protein